MYGFASGDPINFADPFGLWPTRTHNALLDYAFKGHVSAAALAALKDASRQQDGILNGGQSLGRSFMHAMAQPGESPAEAKARRAEFISHSLARARVLAEDGDEAGALRELGNAFHTMMDQTSPAHTQENGDMRTWKTSDVFAHWWAESGTPSAATKEALAQRMERAYERVFGRP